MKIIIAPDSFKDGLNAVRASKVILKAFKEVNDNYDYITIPISDGGEGILKILANKTIETTVTGPLGKKTKAEIGFLENEKTIILEMALAAGIEKVKKNKRNANYTTSYGVGELLVKALKYKPEKIILGLGGSATNDLGFGALNALGINFYDSNNKEVGIFGKDIFNIKTIDSNNINKQLKEVELILAVDVTNPLLGHRGSTYVYGLQKGLGNDELSKYDKQFKVLSTLLNNHFKTDFTNHDGSGAAGGIAYSFSTAFGGKITRGFDVVYKHLKIEEKLLQADYLITAEGKVDKQTLNGKAPYQLSVYAKRINPKIKTILFVGTNNLKSNEIFDKIIVINDPKLTLEENITNTKNNLYKHSKFLLNDL